MVNSDRASEIDHKRVTLMVERARNRIAEPPLHFTGQLQQSHAVRLVDQSVPVRRHIQEQVGAAPHRAVVDSKEMLQALYGPPFVRMPEPALPNRNVTFRWQIP